MIQFSLVEVYSNNLLETTPMNEVLCWDFKVQKYKEQEMKNWKGNKVDKTDFFDLSLGLFLGPSLLFILLKDDHRTALLTVKSLLHDR